MLVPRILEVIVSHLSSVRSLVRLAERGGVEPVSFLKDAGLGPTAELILNADLSKTARAHWLPIDGVFAVWDQAAAQLHGTDFVLEHVQALKPEGLGTLGFGMLTAASLDEALKVLTTGFELVTNSGHWQRIQDACSVTLRWERAACSVGQGLSNEAIFGHVVSLLGDLSGEPVVPIRVTFAHARSSLSRALEPLFGCQVEYGVRHNALTFARDVLQARPRASHAGMGQYFQQRMRDSLELVASKRSVLDSLRHELRHHAGLREGSLAQAAASVGVSARTLQRRLEHAKTSFSRELDVARRERALQLVTSTQRPLSDIALELGFADASVFSRAFRNWYGDQPRAVRIRHEL
jgi:AraC-like DNA-binding protein